MLVGKIAKNMAVLEPQNTVASIKRKMGQDVEVTIGNRKMRPEEISSVILQKIRQTELNTSERNIERANYLHLHLKRKGHGPDVEKN